ncbi:hypothetical protein DTO166G4_6531 [Paecilomyces variotii]|nr:hypothetical protein DTO166G4_6531 [Paecilomyces variotii]KAJ9228277.1 hypothetical protein DTO166G5_8717 [Paecilomyces variotii]KAJ9367662.1 hypothetical protein DTO282E5_7659 [Paecilomyces variotii]
MPRQRHPQLTTLLIRLLLFEFLSCSLVVVVDASSMAITHKLDPIMMRMLYGQMVKRKDDNLQVFKGVMGAAAPAITDTGNPERPFGVDGDTFTDFQSAGERSCDNQFNSCQLKANTNKTSNFTVKDCESQQKQCRLAQSAASVTRFAAIADVTNAAPEPQQTFPFDEEFDIVCDVPDV